MCLSKRWQNTLMEQYQIKRQGRVYNFVMNVTPLCDCVPWSGRPIAHDIGILASTDPVAIEQACYDLICKEMGHDVFKHEHPHVNGTRIIDYACEMGMGSKEYELIKL